jgi:hypothetical protein
VQEASLAADRHAEQQARRGHVEERPDRDAGQRQPGYQDGDRGDDEALDARARPASTACTASAVTTPRATSGTQDAGTRPGPVANPRGLVVTRVPEFPATTGFPFDHSSRLRPVAEGTGIGSVDGLRPAVAASGLAQTIHSPGVTSVTFAVTETGPLPGTTLPVVSVTSKRSPGRGRPVAPARWPENLTDSG